MPPVRTLAVWCPDWPVVAAAALGGIPAHRPVAVVAANRVVACSAQARANGVRRGQRRREAQGNCPDLVVLADDPDRDARAFEPVVCAVEELAPGVEVIRPGLVVLAARGPAGYFGGEFAAAERIIDAVLAGTGVECQVGIADGIFPATLAARRGLVVGHGDSPAFLAPLPVTELGQPEVLPPGKLAVARAELIDLLRRLGLRTLGALAALPVAEVAARFGAGAVLAHRLAGGTDERPVARRQPPADLTVTRRFDPPIERVDAAAFAARQPAAELHDRLAGRGLACTRLGVLASTGNGEELARVWRCAGPLTPSGIADRVRWQLDSWLTNGVPTAGVSSLRLVPAEVVPVGATQHDLWSDGPDSWGGDGDGPAGRALVRVQGMLGPDAVLTGVPSGGRDSAGRITLVPWGDERVPARCPDSPWPGRLPAPSPATVPSPTGRLPATVLGAGGEPVGVTGRGVLTAAPCLVAVHRAEPRAVLAWAGPWPVEERWWDPGGGRRLARLQVVLAAATGSTEPTELTEPTALLLSCEHHRWWIDGIYD